MGAKSYRSHSRRSDSSSGSDHSDDSAHSRDTAPTVYSVRPGLKQHETAAARLETCEHVLEADDQSPRQSTETYASTVPSFDDLPQEPEYEVPEFRHEVYSQDAIPSSPQEFAELFPSSRRLLIQHDDSTTDGNMNLRVDTKVATSGGHHEQGITLFHLRMHDLKDRHFSFRRYCRDSGREVCHSSRKYIEPKTEKRPGFQRSLSNAFSSLRPKSENVTSTMSSIRRHDSGYHSDDDEIDEVYETASNRSSEAPLATNTTRLEFSNYAQVEVKRRGKKASRRYEFEYWGAKYQWRREIRKDGESKEVSHHLFNLTTARAVAQIVPEPLTAAEAAKEKTKGGWIPASSLQIVDKSALGGLTDVADVIVATGLIALVDDAIKRRFHNKRHMHVTLPMKSVFNNKKGSESKKIIDETFNRRGSTATQQRHSPIRQLSAF